MCLGVSQLSLQPKNSTFILRLQGVQSYLQFLLTLLHLFYLLTELLIGDCEVKALVVLLCQHVSDRGVCVFARVQVELTV